MSNDSKTTDHRIEAGAKAWDKYMGGRYTPNEVEELSEEVAVILAAADAVDPRKPRTITAVEELDRELIVKSANSMDAVYLPSQGAPFRNVVTGARVTLEELDACGDFFPVTVLWDPEAEATR